MLLPVAKTTLSYSAHLFPIDNVTVTVMYSDLMGS